MSLKTERLLIRAKKLIKKESMQEAREIYTNILNTFPNNAEAKKGIFLINHEADLTPSQAQLDEVMKFYSKRQFEETLSILSSLINDYPNESLLFNICGACLNELNKNESAITNFNKAIELRPNYAEAFYNLGVVYQKIKNNDKALDCYENALVIQHAYPTAHNNLGMIYLEKDETNSAIKSFEWAIAYSPNYSQAHNNLGSAFQKINQFESAKVQFEKALTINPNDAQALENLGILCEIINLPIEAIKNYEKAIKVNPYLTAPYLNLSYLKKISAKDPLIVQMESLYSKIGLNSADKAALCFALAKIHENLNNKDKFFRYLDEGNELKKSLLNYDIDTSENFHSSVIKLFKTPQSVINKKQDNSSTIRPIFILGMPRSGTSLVEQIISSHHAVYGAGELHTLRKIIDPILFKHLKAGKETLQKKELLSIREQYLETLSNFKTSEKIITDKMPVNFRLIGFILSAIPEAKIIHLKRDARATCWSNYKHYFSEGNGFAFNQEDLAKFYALYSEMMGFWHKLFPNRIYDISYEELTKNQKKETQKLLNYCDLDWDEDCLNFHKNTRGVVTASSSQVRQKMYQGSSDVWKKYEPYLKPLIDGLKSY